MPCTMTGSLEGDRNLALQQACDHLTHENDQLREMVLKLLDGKKLSKLETDTVWRNQIAHRKEDLARLEKTLRRSIADQRAMGRNPVGAELTSKLGAVITADPQHPLEPQLGFDPDSL